MSTAKVSKRQAASIKRANKARIKDVNAVTAKRTASARKRMAVGEAGVKAAVEAKSFSPTAQKKADTMAIVLPMLAKGATLAELAKASGATENSLRHRVRALNPTSVREKDRGVVFTVASN